MLTAVCATSTTTVGSARRIRVGSTGPLRSSARLASLRTGGEDEEAGPISALAGGGALRPAWRGGASFTSVTAFTAPAAIVAYYITTEIYNSLHNARQHCPGSRCCRSIEQIAQSRICRRAKGRLGWARAPIAAATASAGADGSAETRSASN